VSAPIPDAKPVVTEKPAVSPTPAAALQTAPTAAPISAPSLADLLESRILHELDAPRDDVHITIETVNPAVRKTPAAGREWLVKPLTRTFLGMVQFEAQLVDGDKILQRLTVSAQVEKKARVVIAIRPLARGDIAGAADVKESEIWLDRSMPTLFSSAEDAIGLEAKTPISPGQNLDQRDFKPSEMASRGDDITVIFVTKTLKVQSRATAMESGKLHSAISVRNQHTNEEYQAVLIGKRLAVVGAALSPEEEAELRESKR
jgi:flagella basal body P-ring formation protein FlgA